MRLCEDIVNYDLMDDITSDDLNKKSSVDSIIAADEHDEIRVVDATFASENYWFGFFVNLKDPDDRKTIERCVEIFEAYKPIDEYLLCKVEGHDSSFDILFNIQSNYIVPLFQRFIFPLLTVCWRAATHWGDSIGISGYMEGKEPSHYTLWDTDVEYLFRTIEGKGVFTDRLHWYIINMLLQFTNKDIDQHKMKYVSFYQFLLFSVFKREWIQKFNRLKTDENGMHMFDVELMLYSYKDSKWYNDCVFHVKAPDSTTMALKLFLFAAFTQMTHRIQYHLSETYSDVDSYWKALNSKKDNFGLRSEGKYTVVKKNGHRNYGKHIIPMNDQLFKKYSRWGMMSNKERFEEVIALVEGTEYEKYVAWMRDNASTYENCATGGEIIANLEALAAVTQKYKI